MTGRRVIGLIALIVLVLAVPIALMIRILPLPYVWIFSAWTILFLLFIPVFRGGGRIVCLNLALICFVLLGFEVILRVLPEDPPELLTGSYWECVRGDPYLGYAASPNCSGEAVKHFDEEEIYRVTYATGPDGLRVTPEPADSVKASILMFGCSMTWGNGLYDEETFPYLVGVRTQGTYKIHNFAVHGYGPHQMLSALEHGYVRERVVHPPRYAIYVGGYFHARRVRGVSWDTNGPRYLIEPDGSVKYHGRFSDPRSRSEEAVLWVRARLKLSALGKEILARVAPDAPEDPDLMLAVVQASRERITKEYPGCEFHVVFWNDYEDGSLASGLESIGMNVHRITSFIPDIYTDPLKYHIHEHDGHPSRLASELIANYIVESIIQDSERNPN